MKNYFLSLLLLAIFSSCDFLTTPYVVGSGTISFDEHNGYTCKIDNMTIKVDSVLTNNTKKRTFTQPQEGQTVTLFLLSSKQYLCNGIASSQEIKNCFFSIEEVETYTVIAVLVIGLIILLKSVGPTDAYI